MKQVFEKHVWEVNYKFNGNEYIRRYDNETEAKGLLADLISQGWSGTITDYDRYIILF